VLAEQVTVVEGSAPCCESPATTTPPSPAGDSGTSAPLPVPAAVGCRGGKCNVSEEA